MTTPCRQAGGLELGVHLFLNSAVNFLFLSLYAWERAQVPTK